MTEFHPAFEEYCECIFELDEDGVEPIQARIADRLKVSRASVSEMIKRMEADELVTLNGSRIGLSNKGKILAQGIVRKHRLAECFLIDVLKLPWSTAHHEACKWEHVLTDEVEVALASMLGHPTTCPHGNPIPGSSYRQVPLMALRDVEPGQSFVVMRISEELEETSGVLDGLEARQILPGRIGEVVSRGANSELIVKMSESVDGQEVSIDSFTCSRLQVTLSS